MLHGPHLGELEVRRGVGGKRRLRGRFPYRKRAVLSDGGRNGRPKKEEFAPRAFAYRVEDPAAEIHLLIGHDYDRPLASKLTGGLSLRDSDDALTFDADISPEIQATSYFADFIAGFTAGLIVGLSPGFRIPPPRAVPPEEAEEVTEEEPEEGNALIRTIFQALLYEFSLVTVPAYKETQVEARSGLLLPPPPALGHLRRWRL